MADFVEDVKRYATRNYERSGWDILIECYTDEDIATLVEKCLTIEGAIKKCRAEVKPQADHRAEIQATEW